MDARSEIQTELAEAFSNDEELGQAYHVFAAERVEAGSYDPATGSTNNTVIKYAGSYWQDTFTFSELETINLDSADLKIGILANATTEYPAVDDTFTLGGGIAARVMSVKPDPLEATLSIRLRVN
jgi:hypothetical protein